MIAVQRLAKELIALNRFKQRDSNRLYNAYPSDPENLFMWIAKIKGPEDSPYENGVWELEMTFPSDYPIEAPQIRFITPIAHPNVGEDGEICLDILSEEWTPSLRIDKILISLISLLTDPNPDSPMRDDLAILFYNNYEEYESEIREHTQENALFPDFD